MTRCRSLLSLRFSSSLEESLNSLEEEETSDEEDDNSEEEEDNSLDDSDSDKTVLGAFFNQSLRPSLLILLLLAYKIVLRREK